MPAGREKSLTLIEKAILLFIGFAGGSIVAAGVYSFITMLQIIQRLSSNTGTAKYVTFYEDCVMMGGILGNAIYLFEWKLPFGQIFMGVYGVPTGMFVGCLAFALAEVIDVFPAIYRRLSLTMGIPYLIICMAVGKGLGAMYQLIINR